jgi:uncharacterized protein YndB with AHSA1/START domain
MLRQPVALVHGHILSSWSVISVMNEPSRRDKEATMSPIVSTIEIGRPPEEVFSYVTDPSRFAEWQKDVVSVRLAKGGPPGVGAKFTTTRRIGGVDRIMTQEITESSPPRSWSAHGVSGPIRPSANITVEPLNDGSRSRVTFALDFEGHGIGVPLVPLVRRQAKKGAPISYRNLKKLLESGDDRAAGYG